MSQVGLAVVRCTQVRCFCSKASRCSGFFLKPHRLYKAEAEADEEHARLDASNGWFANHPLQKLQYYQAFLRDQAAEAAAAARAKAKEPKKKQPKAAKRSATPPAEEDDEEDRPLKKKKSESCS